MTHPDLEQLFQYIDGDLDASARRKLDRHLAGCIPCSIEIRRLRDAASHGSAPQAMPPEKVLEGIRQWVGKRRDSGSGNGSVRERVAAEISPFLGEGASRSIMQRVDPDAGNLLTIVEPVLGTFLGTRAAGRLVDRIVSRTIMRI